MADENLATSRAPEAPRPAAPAPVRVQLDAADIVVDRRRVAIAPGMQGNAEIITGNRRVIDYVLSPVLRYRDEAGRERWVRLKPSPTAFVDGQVCNITPTAFLEIAGRFRPATAECTRT